MHRLRFASVEHHMRISGFLRLCCWLLILSPLVDFSKAEASEEKNPKATSAESLTLLPGFKAELLRSAQKGEGSWICMTTDQKGRLIISPQDDKDPLLRLTLSRAGQVTKVEK